MNHSASKTDGFPIPAKDQPEQDAEEEGSYFQTLIASYLIVAFLRWKASQRALIRNHVCSVQRAKQEIEEKSTGSLLYSTPQTKHKVKWKRVRAACDLDVFCNSSNLTNSSGLKTLHRKIDLYRSAILQNLGFETEGVRAVMYFFFKIYTETINQRGGQTLSKQLY